MNTLATIIEFFTNNFHEEGLILAVDPLTAMLIISGISAVVSGAQTYLASEANEQNIQSQKETNAQNLQLQRELNMQNRQWALEDWEKTTAYNDPSQQMQRFKEAGLNPHLIYGRSGDNTSAMVRTVPTQFKPMEPVKSDPTMLLNALTGIQSAPTAILDTYTQMKRLQMQDDLNTASIEQMNANTVKTLAQANNYTFDYDLKKATEDMLKAKATQDYIYKFKATEKLDKEIKNMPTQKMAMDNYFLELAKKDAQGKHAQELYELAKKQNLLKQQEVDMLMNLKKIGTATPYVIEILKAILGK